jgi:hypothetical protein
VVKVSGKNSEHEIIVGVAYSIHIAIRENKAVVINLSSARNIAGAHDGNATLEKLIDAALDHHESNKNVSLVTIASNFAASETHATGSVTHGDSVTVKFPIFGIRAPTITS